MSHDILHHSMRRSGKHLNSRIWQEAECVDEPATDFEQLRSCRDLYDPDAVAGMFPFVLPRSHWLTNAARVHDPWYDAAAAGEIERTPENKAQADTEFLNVALIDARHIAKHGCEEIQDYEEYAHLCSEATAAYLLIRSPAGDLAWYT